MWRCRLPATTWNSTRRHAQVRLKEHGSELVEVSDNGCGVDPSNYEALTAKYHTSKVRLPVCAPPAVRRSSRERCRRCPSFQTWRACRASASGERR